MWNVFGSCWSLVNLNCRSVPLALSRIGVIRLAHIRGEQIPKAFSAWIAQHRGDQQWQTGTGIPKRKYTSTYNRMLLKCVIKLSLFRFDGANCFPLESGGEFQPMKKGSSIRNSECNGWWLCVLGNVIFLKTQLSRFPIYIQPRPKSTRTRAPLPVKGHSQKRGVEMDEDREKKQSDL